MAIKRSVFITFELKYFSDFERRMIHRCFHFFSQLRKMKICYVIRFSPTRFSYENNRFSPWESLFWELEQDDENAPLFPLLMKTKFPLLKNTRYLTPYSSNYFHYNVSTSMEVGRANRFVFKVSFTLVFGPFPLYTTILLILEKCFCKQSCNTYAISLRDSHVRVFMSCVKLDIVSLYEQHSLWQNYIAGLVRSGLT